MPTTYPLKGKMVFFDTKIPAPKLRQQLECLGARVETFFSKDIWCVITDKQIIESNKTLICSSKSNIIVKKRTPFLNRTQALLQAAQKHETKKKDDQIQTVVQECKQWDIPMLSVKTASSNVSQLMKKFKSPPRSPSKALQSKKQPVGVTPMRKVVSDSMLGRGEKIPGEFSLKLEDTRQLYRPVHKSFTKQEWPALNVQPPSTSSPLLSPFFAAEDLVRNGEQPHKSNKEVDEVDSKSRPKSHESRKRKYTTTKSLEQKQKFCELCQEYYTSLRSHLTSSQHMRAYGNVAVGLEKMITEFQTDLGDCFESPSKRSRTVEQQTAEV